MLHRSIIKYIQVADTVGFYTVVFRPGEIWRDSDGNNIQVRLCVYLHITAVEAWVLGHTSQPMTLLKLHMTALLDTGKCMRRQHSLRVSLNACRHMEVASSIMKAYSTGTGSIKAAAPTPRHCKRLANPASRHGIAHHNGTPVTFNSKQPTVKILDSLSWVLQERAWDTLARAPMLHQPIYAHAWA